MEFKLPSTVGARQLSPLFEICGQALRSDDKELIFSGEDVEFIDPVGLAVLGALFESLPGRSFVMPWLTENMAGYLARMDFFKHFDVEGVLVPDWGRNDRRQRLVELTCLRSGTDSERIANLLADAITGTLTHANPSDPYDPETGKNQFDKFRHPIWYSLSELLENSLTHARRDGNWRASVWVSAQYYETNRMVKMAVVDNGCGILATLRNHSALPEKTNLSAIRTALIPKVSCNRDGGFHMEHGNQGVGLTTTDRIARAAFGGLVIASGDAMLDTQTSRETLLSNNGYWPGVAISFSCRRRALPSIRVSDLLPQEESIVDVQFTE